MMKLTIKSILFVLLLTFGIISLTADFDNAAAAASAAGSPAQIYIKNCARCHGADGKSDTELGKLNDAPDLTAHKRSAKGTANIIKNGEGSMPGFGKKISAKDIAALVKYVRAL